MLCEGPCVELSSSVGYWCCNDRALRVVLSGVESAWRSVVSARDQYWVQCWSVYSSTTWTMEGSASSASLLVTQSSEEQLNPPRAVLPFRGISTGWRVGPRQTS